MRMVAIMSVDPGNAVMEVFIVVAAVVVDDVDETATKDCPFVSDDVVLTFATEVVPDRNAVVLTLVNISVVLVEDSAVVLAIVFMVVDKEDSTVVVVAVVPTKLEVPVMLLDVDKIVLEGTATVALLIVVVIASTVVVAVAAAVATAEVIEVEVKTLVLVVEVETKASGIETSDTAATPSTEEKAPIFAQVGAV